ncbi:MAG: alpha/beta hydrolase [Actinomycetota bacterium]
MRPRRFALGGILALVLVAVTCTTGGDDRPPSTSAAPSGSTGPAAEPEARIERCADAPRDRCGTIHVPLSWSEPVATGTIGVRFRVFTRTDRRAEPEDPIVAFEGGPGYGSIGSAGSYRFLFAPLLRSRDLILMDQRGTGGSGAIDCPALQEGVGDYADAAGDCAESLAGAANAYGTAAAADDLAAILDALDVPRVVVYGDSYGTYLAQVFAIRHPDRTAAVVLDAAYDDAFDPFARDAAAALERSWATLCRRAGTCAGIVEEIAALARRLERRPLVGTGVDSAGDRYRVELTAPALAQLLYDATYVFTIYRDFPAALGALKRGDPEPLLRLAAEDLVSLGGGGNPRAYSEGAYAAIACHDYPTVWDRGASVDERRAQLGAAIGELAPDAFAPFANPVWLESLYEYQLVAGCLEWPAPDAADPPTPTRAPHPDLPVLVLNGELDVTTPLRNAADAAAAWPNSVFVPVVNEIHVTALYDYERCASRIVLRFVRTGEAGDTSCADETPEVHVVEAFPETVADAPQASPAGDSDRSTPTDRRVAWTAAETVGDALSRWWNVLYGGTGVGLRGGTYRMRGPYLSFSPPLTIALNRTRLVSEVAVSGRVVWRRREAVVIASLRVQAPGATGTLRVAFGTDRRGDETTIRGRLGGRPVSLTMPGVWSP